MALQKKTQLDKISESHIIAKLCLKTEIEETCKKNTAISTTPLSKDNKITV